MAVRDSCEDVVILRKVHRYQDFDESISPEKRSLYAEEAAKFLLCTRGMADCTWTRAQRDWLARRNRSVLQQTPEGRAQLQRLERAPLLMDTKKDKSTGQVGADRLNELRLQDLSARTGEPIVALGAHHDKPADQPDLKAELLDADNFRGMQNLLLMCGEARVLLTDNTWIEAGLMNGALGTLKGYMWPEGGDPNLKDSKLRTPLCCIVEFDDVNLKDENGVLRTFFPGEPEKARWVPVFRKQVQSCSDEGVYRLQFPLVLAWALTHWKAQGMTLAGSRVHLSQKTVGVAGLAFVASTRVRHPWDLVFEDDLPDYEDFMKARGTRAFRRRRRWELRLQERASITLRKYGFCSEDDWSKDESEAADSLIAALKRVAEKQRETLRLGAGCVVDDDTWLWGEQEPCYEALLCDARRELELADADQSRHHLYEFVVQRLLDRKRRRVVSVQEKDCADQLLRCAEQLGQAFDADDVIRRFAGETQDLFDQYAEVARLVRRRLAQVEAWDGMIEEAVPVDVGELHLPAVKGALGALIPAKLHARFDKSAAKQKIPKDVPVGGSYLRCDGWRVSVYEEESLSRGRLGVGMLEFFLKLLERCSSEMCLRVSVASRTLGKLVGTAATVDVFRSVLSRWRECWNPVEVKKRQVLLLPVPTVDVPEPRDWVLAVVRARDGSSSLGQAKQLEVAVYDRVVRKTLSERIARYVQALFSDGAAMADPVILQEDLPECPVATQRSGCVLAVIATLLQERAGQVFLDRSSLTFVPDMFAVFTSVFAMLRAEFAARILTDVREYVVGEEARKVLSMFGEVPRLRGGLLAGQTVTSVRGLQDSGSAILKAATWNVSGGKKSDQAPATWLLADQRNALVNEVLRWECDVVALQEIECEEPLESLMHRYSHVGSSRSHRGFVHLYVSKKLTFVVRGNSFPGVVVCSLSMNVAGGGVEHRMTLAAVHLPSGMAQAQVGARSRILVETVTSCDDAGVLILGDTNCKDDEATDVCKKTDLREASYTGASWGSRSNRYDASVEYEGFGFRYDRMFTARSIWAETFLIANRKVFFEGCEFFLSDHFPVVGFFECHPVFQESGRASIALAGARRSRLVALRDRRLREEQLDSFELLKRGREEKAFAKHAAVEEVRVAALRAQREALIERDRLARERWDVSVGARSVWRGQIEQNGSRDLARLSLAGWEEDSWDVEVPTAVFLRGITSGQTDVVMPCFLQVILRLPHMHAWMAMHAEHCRKSSGCALCWLATVRKALEVRMNRRNVQVGFLPKNVEPCEVQDMKAVFEHFLDVLSRSEIDSGRFGQMSAPAFDTAVVTHVDRLFSWFQQTRERCGVCGLEGERTTLSKSRILTLSLSLSKFQNCTVTDLYLQSCVPNEDVRSCVNCSGPTNHHVASRVATTPELLLLWLDRGSGNETIPVDVEEDLMLPGLVALRLLAVIYSARRHDGTACYSCACRGPMDAWWYFEEGRAPQPIKRSISHVKQRLSCMLFYERVVTRGRTLKRKDAGSSRGGGRPSKRLRTDILSSAVRSPPVSAPLTAWPVRALKRYPSWVSQLQLEPILQASLKHRQARFEQDSARFVERCYDDVVAAGGGVPLRYTLPVEFASVGSSLAEAVLAEIVPRPEQLVFALACIANAFDQLRRTSKDDQFVAVCGHAYQFSLGEALYEARRCQDPSSSIGVVSRVTGIVDLDDLQLEENRQARFQARFEQRAVCSVSQCYCDLVAPAGGEPLSPTVPEQFQSLGVRLGESVSQSVIGDLEEHINTSEDLVLAYSCIAKAFGQMRRTSEDRQFVAICAHAYRWCVGQAQNQARECDDESVALELSSRVAGFADSGDPVSLDRHSSVAGEKLADVVDIGEVVGEVEGAGSIDPISCGDDAKPASPKAKPTRRRKHIASQDVEPQPVRRSARIASRASLLATKHR